MKTIPGQQEAAPGARPLPGLSRLIHPVDVMTFQREYWERQPLLIHRDRPEYYADVLALDDVDRLLTTISLKLEGLRVVSAGREMPVSRLAKSGRNGTANTLEALYTCYRNGATIVLNSLQQQWGPLQQLSRELGREMSTGVQTNVYVTPTGAQGFAAHYDTHDVFIVQVHGTKRWWLARQPYGLPLRDQLYDKSRPEPAAEREFDLNCGDLLYMPRGTIHWASSSASTSVHITIGIHPVTYAEALGHALDQLFTDDIRFRRALPLGFATDEDRQRLAAETLTALLSVAQQRLLPTDMVADSVIRATSISPPTLRHHLTDLEKVERVTTNTRLRRRLDQRWNISVIDGTVKLDFHNKTIQLPADVASQLRYIAESGDEGFIPDAIPGDLDEPSRLLLAKTLIREGFLTLS